MRRAVFVRAGAEPRPGREENPFRNSVKASAERVVTLTRVITGARRDNPSLTRVLPDSGARRRRRER